MKRRNRNWNIEEPSINLTPLIDVVFVILIAFLVIAPLLEVDLVQLAEAASESSQTTSADKQSPISIYVFQNNKIRFNQEEILMEQLESILKEAKMQHPEAIPQLFHDQKAYFGTYQGIKNAAESAGFDQMEIVLSPNATVN